MSPGDNRGAGASKSVALTPTGKNELMGEENSIVITKGDRRAVVRAALAAGWRLITAAAAIIGVVLGVFLALIYGFIDQPAWLVVAIGGVTLLVLAPLVIDNRRRLRASIPVGSTSAISLSPESLSLEGHGGASQFSWGQVSELRRSGSAVVFTVSGTRLVIPGRMVTAEAFATMLSRIEEHATRGTDSHAAAVDEPIRDGDLGDVTARTITLTADDRRAIRNGVWGQAAIVVVVVAVIGATLIVGGVADLFTDAGRSGAVLLACGILFWALCAGLLYTNARRVRSAWPLGSRYSVRLLDDAIEFGDAAATSQTRWAQVSQVRRRKGVVLMTMNGTPQTIPARLISPEIFASIEKRVAEASAR